MCSLLSIDIPSRVYYFGRTQKKQTENIYQFYGLLKNIVFIKSQTFFRGENKTNQTNEQMK